MATAAPSAAIASAAPTEPWAAPPRAVWPPAAAWSVRSWLGAAALAGALLGAFARLLEAVGIPVDGDDLGVVDEAIDQRDDACGVGEDLAPFGERAVGGDQRAPDLVAARDQLEHQVGVAVGGGEKANPVGDQQLWGGGGGPGPGGAGKAGRAPKE